ncbi:hypothetical protein, partial [Acinetobacter baumannii]|uniref:hypothetical protein n=1 Tax=Acinetobacter baumannii TaxID=470 RepID=UPI001488D979
VLNFATANATTIDSGAQLDLSGQTFAIASGNTLQLVSGGQPVGTVTVSAGAKVELDTGAVLSALALPDGVTVEVAHGGTLDLIGGAQLTSTTV